MRNGAGIMLLGMAALFGGPSLAFANDSHCDNDVGERRPTTPDDDFTNLGNGVIEHRPTGLQWAQCALGQRASGNTCVGQAGVYTWQEAREAVEQANRSGRIAGQTDWRLPSVDELATLIEKCRQAPAINTTQFPNTPWSGFWTSTMHFDGARRVDDYDPDHVDADAEEGAHKDDDPDRDRRPMEAWFVGFYEGLEYPYNIDSAYRVRVVREP